MATVPQTRVSTKIEVALLLDPQEQFTHPADRDSGKLVLVDVVRATYNGEGKTRSLYGEGTLIKADGQPGKVRRVIYASLRNVPAAVITACEDAYAQAAARLPATAQDDWTDVVAESSAQES
jgi:hypothetical protein